MKQIMRRLSKGMKLEAHDYYVMSCTDDVQLQVVDLIINQLRTFVVFCSKQRVLIIEGWRIVDAWEDSTEWLHLVQLDDSLASVPVIEFDPDEFQKRGKANGFQLYGLWPFKPPF